MATNELKLERIAYCAGMDPEDYKAACSITPGVSHIDYPNYDKIHENRKRALAYIGKKE